MQGSMSMEEANNISGIDFWSERSCGVFALFVKIFIHYGKDSLCLN